MAVSRLNDKKVYLSVKDKWYPLEVWLTTIIAGAVSFTLYDSWNGVGEFFLATCTLILFNILLGVPALIMFFSCFFLINNCRVSILIKRGMLVAVAFLLFLVSWVGINMLFGRDVFFANKSIFIYIDFLVCIIIADFIYGRRTMVQKK